MTPAEFKQARQSLGLVQQQMAGMLGYGDKSRISAIENGRDRITDTVARLMQAYASGYRPPDWPDKA